jgi:cytochrome P450
MTALAHPDLTDPRVHAEDDLSGLWRYLRAERPVHWRPPATGRPGFWVVTRHADVVSVYRDPKRFTSQRGNVLDTLLGGGDPAVGRMLAVSDGQHHAEVRKILSKALAPRVLDVVLRSVRATTTALIQDALAQGGCDFATDIAAKIPLTTICELLDVPAADRGYILSLTSSALSGDQAPQTAAGAWLAKSEILLYFAELARTRRDTPHGDLVSLLASSRVNGSRLPTDEVMLNCYSLILGGDETTRLSMIGAVDAFIAYPDQWRALGDGTATVDSAVEEILRWTTPALHGGRTATEDVTLAGQRIRAGDIVTVWNASANRDEREFADPDRFDLTRSPNRHVTLGYGPHFCVGAHVARTQLRFLLSGLRELVSGIRPAGPSRRIYSNFLSGMSSLPVSLTG